MSSTEEEESVWFNIDPESGQVSMAQDLPPDKLSQPVTLVVRVSLISSVQKIVKVSGIWMVKKDGTKEKYFISLTF